MTFFEYDLNQDSAFDFALAFWHWLQQHCGGMDDKYEAFCQLKMIYKPAPSEEFLNNMNGDSVRIYRALNEVNWRPAFAEFMEFVAHLD